MGNITITNMQQAVEVVKDFFRTVKGADKISGRDIIDWLNFNVVSAKEKYDDYGDKQFEIICELNEGLFSANIEKFSVTVNTKGEVISAERIGIRNALKESKNE